MKYFLENHPIVLKENVPFEIILKEKVLAKHLVTEIIFPNTAIEKRTNIEYQDFAGRFTSSMSNQLIYQNKLSFGPGISDGVMLNWIVFKIIITPKEGINCSCSLYLAHYEHVL